MTTREAYAVTDLLAFLPTGDAVRANMAARQSMPGAKAYAFRIDIPLEHQHRFAEALDAVTLASVRALDEASGNEYDARSY